MRNFFLVLFLLVLSQINNAQDYAQIENQIQTIWNNKKQGYTDRINQDLPLNNSSILYDLQLETFNLLIYTHNQKRYELMDDLIGVYLEAFKHIKYKRENKIITAIGSNASLDTYCSSNFAMARPMWMVNYNKTIKNSNDVVIRTISFEQEHSLNSGNFLQMVARAMLYASQVPIDQRGGNINVLLSNNITNIIIDHYKRWLNEDTTSQAQGWGCDPHSSLNCYTMREYLEIITNGNLWKNNINNKQHCNAIIGEIMSAIGGVSDILASHEMNSTGVGLKTPVKSIFVDFVKKGSTLIESRLSDKPNNGMVMDAGYWKNHTEYKFSNTLNEVSCATMLTPSVNEETTVDLSHARKWVHVFESLHLNRWVVNSSFPDEEIMTKLSNQFAYNVFNGDYKFPLFSNYFGGAKGWHRVDYKKGKDKNGIDQKGNGYAPYFYSVVAYEGGFTFWSTYNKGIEKIRNSLWDMINDYSTDVGVKNHMDKYYDVWYARCNSLSDFKNFDTPDSSTDLLQFLPTFFPRKIKAKLHKKNFVVRDSQGHLYLYPFGDTNHSFFDNNGGSMVGSDWTYPNYFPEDWTGDGKTDLLVRDTKGDLYLYWLNSNDNFFEGRTKVGSDWSYVDYFPGNWTGDNRTDLLVRDTKGDLYLYWLNSNNSFFEGRTKVGSSWPYTDYFPGDWRGDGKTDLLVRDTKGDLYLYWLNNNDSFFEGRLKVGSDWSYIDYFPGDWTGDGKTDVLVRDTKGDLYLYWLNNNNSFFEGRTKVGSDWSYIDYFPCDWTGDVKTDLLVRDTKGDLYLYWLNHNNSFFEGREYVGNNWQFTDYFIFEKSDPVVAKTNKTDIAIGAEMNMKISIFPNPNSGEFFLNSNNEIEAIKIYDMLGKNVSFIREGSHFKLDKGSVVGNVIFVKIYQNDKVNIRKIIISN